jgi:hypothetical protein
MSQIIKNLAAGPVPPSVATSYQAQTNGVNTGVAVPAANVLTLNGMDGVAISGSGSTLTFTGIFYFRRFDFRKCDYSIAKRSNNRSRIYC